jgi:hypothetical protein
MGMMPLVPPADYIFFMRRVINILSIVTLPNNWDMLVDSSNGRVYMQIASPKGTCNYSGEEFAWKGRKWFLSEHMTDGEVVQTALVACLAASEHEIREQFKYRGVSIFDPHYDIERLVELRSDPSSIKERDHA